MSFIGEDSSLTIPDWRLNLIIDPSSNPKNPKFPQLLTWQHEILTPLFSSLQVVYKEIRNFKKLLETGFCSLLTKLMDCIVLNDM